MSNSRSSQPSEFEKIVKAFRANQPGTALAALKKYKDSHHNTLPLEEKTASGFNLIHAAVIFQKSDKIMEYILSSLDLSHPNYLILLNAVIEDKERRYVGWNALAIAIEKKKFHYCQTLVEYGATIVCPDDSKGLLADIVASLPDTRPDFPDQPNELKSTLLSRLFGSNATSSASASSRAPVSNISTSSSLPVPNVPSSVSNSVPSPISSPVSSTGLDTDTTFSRILSSYSKSLTLAEQRKTPSPTSSNSSLTIPSPVPSPLPVHSPVPSHLSIPTSSAPSYMPHPLFYPYPPRFPMAAQTPTQLLSSPLNTRLPEVQPILATPTQAPPNLSGMNNMPWYNCGMPYYNPLFWMSPHQQTGAAPTPPALQRFNFAAPPVNPAIADAAAQVRANEPVSLRNIGNNKRKHP